MGGARAGTDARGEIGLHEAVCMHNALVDLTIYMGGAQSALRLTLVLFTLCMLLV